MRFINQNTNLISFLTMEVSITKELGKKLNIDYQSMVIKIMHDDNVLCS